MQSKQLNFFFHPSEIKILGDFFEEKRCLFVNCNKEGKVEVFNSLVEAMKQFDFQIYITHSNFSDNVLLKEVDTDTPSYLDIVKSSLIEFDIGGYYNRNNKAFHISRLYYCMGFFEDNLKVKKSSVFLEWASNLITDFRKAFLTKNKTFSNDYITSNCEEWLLKKKVTLNKGGNAIIIEV